jgi:prevent-host-death family protein
VEIQMAQIGAYEAKTHLPALLERVQKGERFIITRHGKPVAELAPFRGHDPQASRSAVAEMRRVRASLRKKGVRIGKVLDDGETLRDLAHLGHRF